MKLLRNEKGLTIAELLATIVIGSMVVVLIISIHTFVQKQYKSQTVDTKHLTDITIAAKAITKDIRMAEEGEIVVENGNTIKFTERDITYVWDSDKEVLMKNDFDYIYEVKQFNVEKLGNEINIKIESTTDPEIETSIFIR